jgi:hypothetical protein
MPTSTFTGDGSWPQIGDTPNLTLSGELQLRGLPRCLLLEKLGRNQHSHVRNDYHFLCISKSPRELWFLVNC